MQKNAGQSESHSRLGLIFGVSAILLWSFGPALISLGANALPTWRFIALATLIGGTTQLIFHRIHHGQVRSALVLPGRLWLITLLGFALYGLIFPWAVTLARTQQQLCGVTLINYLWPVLTIALGVAWVPNTRFSVRLLAAILLALVGLGLANYKSLQTFISHNNSIPPSPTISLLPYFLALIAAVSWSVYSSLLARWKSWAPRYTTGAAGFLVIALITGVLSLATEGITVARTGPRGLLLAAAYGFGPLGAGYLLWELALARAKIQTLGIFGAVTPILALLVLCLFLWFVPGVEIVLAAVLIAIAVMISL